MPPEASQGMLSYLKERLLEDFIPHRDSPAQYPMAHALPVLRQRRRSIGQHGGRCKWAGLRSPVYTVRSRCAWGQNICKPIEASMTANFPSALQG